MTAVALFRRLSLGVMLVVAGAGLATVSAQNAPRAAAPAAPAGPSAAAISLAKELLVLKGGQQMFDGMIVGVIESAKNSFLPSNPSLNTPLNEVTVQLRKEYDSKKAESFNEVARAYARHFTEQELRELLAFYKTTLGKKVLADESPAVEDGFKRAQEWTNEFSDQVINRMRAEMKKKGYDL
jgi:hypothetical protein